MSDKIYIRRGNRKDLPALAAGEPGLCTDTGEFFIGSAFGNLPFGNATVGNRTIYVSPTGSNTTGDGTIGNPYATITFVLSRLPRTLDHTVTINVANGTYAEDLLLSGFPSGKGSIAFSGDSVVSTSRSLSSLTVANCSIPVTFTGFNIYITSANGVTVVNCINVTLDKFNIVGVATAQRGVSATNSKVKVSNSTISNRQYGLIADEAGEIISQANTGTGNTTGIFGFAGVVRKNGTQPAGTTAEGVSAGGQIL